MKKILVVGASLALAFAPMSATAVPNPTLPAGDQMFEMPCGVDSVNDRQLFSIDLTNNARTAVGTGEGPHVQGDCASQGAMLPGTDWYYFIDFTGNYLVRANVTTGAIEELGSASNSGAYVGPYSMTIDDQGNAYALSYDTLWSVNLSTGNLTELRLADTYALAEGYPYGFAYDPKTDKFYVAESGDGGLYTLDIATGVFTLVAINEDYWVGSMAFDSNGKIWVNGDGNQISRTSISDWATSADWLDSAALSPNVYSESLVIARGAGGGAGGSGSESLANTGSADVAPILVFGALVGLAAVALRRRAV